MSSPSRVLRIVFDRRWIFFLASAATLAATVAVRAPFAHCAPSPEPLGPSTAPQPCLSEADLRPSPQTAVVDVDNSQTGRCLVLPSSGGTPSRVRLSYEGEFGDRFDDIPFEAAPDGLRVPVFDLLTRLLPGSEGRLEVEAEGRRSIWRLRRACLVPSSYANLDPLYRQMAADIARKGSFLITIPVVLWDSSFTGEGLRVDNKTGQTSQAFWAKGWEPRTNLYWGGATGIETQTTVNHGWKVLSEDGPADGYLKRLVLTRTVAPTAVWRTYGIEKPFKVYLVLLACDFRDILAAYRLFVDLINGSSARRVPLPKGRELDLDDSRVVGVVAHFMPEAHEIFRENPVAPARPRGVFMATCFGATEFGRWLTRPNSFPLFLSIPTTTGEAYAYLPVLDEVLLARGLGSILSAVAKNYFKFQEKTPGARQYTNPSQPTFERALADNSNDWDDDGIVNQFDPDPLAKTDVLRDAAGNLVAFELEDGRTLPVFGVRGEF